MKRFQRFLAGLLAAVLIGGAVAAAVPERAAAQDNPHLDIKLLSSQTNIQAGSPVNVLVRAEQAILRFESLRIVVKYDASKFSFPLNTTAADPTLLNPVLNLNTTNFFMSANSFPSLGIAVVDIKNAIPSGDPKRRQLELPAGTLFTLKFNSSTVAVNGAADFATATVSDTYKQYVRYFTETTADATSDVPDIHDGAVQVQLSGGRDPSMDGSVSLVVDGSDVARFGDKMQAVTSAYEEDISKLKYTWKNSASSQVIHEGTGTAGAVYTLQQADITRLIYVTVEAPGYSAKTAQYPTPVQKALQEKKVDERDINETAIYDNSIVLKPIDGVEFSANTENAAPASGNSWHPNTIGNLLAQTEYYVFARYAATPTHLAGESTYKTIKTSMPTHTLRLVEEPAGGGKAEYWIGEGNPPRLEEGKVSEGQSVKLGATPTFEGEDEEDRYYFEKWVPDGEDLMLPSNLETSFIMPKRNVTIRAVFQKLKLPVILFKPDPGASQKNTYIRQYTGKGIGFSVSDAPANPLPTPYFEYSTYIDLDPETDLQFYYAREGEELPGSKTPPINVGAYTVTVKYAGNEKNRSAEAAATLIITKKAAGDPELPTILAREYDSITFSTTPGQMYLVRPTAEQLVPDTSGSGWQQADGRPMVWTRNIVKATEYTIYTYSPGDENHEMSGIKSVKTSSRYLWELRATEGGRAISALRFFAKEGYSSAALKTVTIENKSDGTVSELTLTLSDDAPFVFGPDLPDKILGPGQSTEVKLRPTTGARTGTHKASLHIKGIRMATGEDGGLYDFISIPLELIVTDKTPVSIHGLEDVNVVYGDPYSVNGEDLTVSSADGILPQDIRDLLKITYTDTDTGKPTTEPPKDAGSYTIRAEIPESDSHDFTGFDTASLVITKRPLTVKGLTVKQRYYDSTTIATLNGGELDNIVRWEDGTYDDVGIAGGIPTEGEFESKDVRLGGSRVFLNELELTGGASKNYAFTQPSDLYGYINPKPVLATLDTVPKVYDGAYLINEPQEAIFLPGVIYEKDDFTVVYTGCTVDDKNVGQNRVVTAGTAIESGRDAINYEVYGKPFTNGATISPCSVTVTIRGPYDIADGAFTAGYDGRPKALTAAYTPFAGDTPRAVVLYNGSAAAPTLAGSYSLNARIDDPNYYCDAIAGPDALNIRLGELLSTDVHRMILPGNTQIRTLPLSEFQIRSPHTNAVVVGSYEILDVVDDDGVLDSSGNYTDIVGNDVRFRGTSTTTLAHKPAMISIEFTPADNTYNKKVVRLYVQVAEEGYSNSLLNAPATVKLGQDIDLTNVYLRTVFDSGRQTEEVLVAQSMLTGEYDKNATGPDALGEKKVTVTYNGNPQRTASFAIQVLDAVVDFKVTPPTKLEYTWMGETKLDLTGGYLQPTMQSTVLGEPIPMLSTMLNITDVTLETLGKHNADVTYNKITKQNQFQIQVIRASNGITVNPPSSQPGVINLDPSIIFKRDNGTEVPAANIRLVVDEVSAEDSARLTAALAASSAFAGILNENRTFMDISLRDDAGAKVYPSGPITVRIPYPPRTGNTTKFTILHLPDKDTQKIYTPTNVAAGLEFTVDTTSPFAVGWAAASTGSSSDSGSSGGSSGSYASSISGGKSITQERAKIFWDSVLTSINAAKTGAVLRVDAKSYDQMPVAVMQAMTKKAITLIISWNGGNDIVITKDTAFTPESSRTYFPLSLLADLYPTDPPKTDDPAEGEAQLRAANAAASAATNPSGSSSSGSNRTSTVARPNTAAERQKLADDYIMRAVAQAQADGADVVDIIAPNIEEDQRVPITPKDAGWTENRAAIDAPIPAAVRPVIQLPENYNRSGGTALLIMMGVLLLLAAGAVLLYLRNNRYAEEEE